MNIGTSSYRKQLNFEIFSELNRVRCLQIKEVGIDYSGMYFENSVFGPWDFQNSQKEVSGNFESQTTFALLMEIYLPCEFHTFSLNHSLETRERGSP
jgi:hypothetical protein